MSGLTRESGPLRAAIPELRVTFGMIVLNAQPFLAYTLAAIYPYAHEIIVVEGATPSFACVATADGHSRDGTLQALERFREDSDPDGKLTILTAETCGYPDGFWPEREQMCAAWADRATGTHIWQIDSDEFYLPADMKWVLRRIGTERIEGVVFPMKTFWGGLNYEVDSFTLRDFSVRRVFEWRPGYTYSSHRPPDVCDASGRSVLDGRILRAAEVRRAGVFLYHYELLFPHQVREKCAGYARSTLDLALSQAREWAESCYMRLERPFRMHLIYRNIAWLRRFSGPHPPAAVRMFEDVKAGRWPGIDVRASVDVDRLLGRWTYRLAGIVLSGVAPFVIAQRRGLRRIRSFLRSVPGADWLRRFRRLPTPDSDARFVGSTKGR